MRMLSNKERKKLIREVQEIYGEDLSNILKKSNLWVVKDRYIMLDNKIIFFYKDDKPIPTFHLFSLIGYVFLKEVKVDEGAIKYVLNGADVFRPGITFFEESIEEGDIVAIYDPKDRLLAVGEALVAYSSFKNMSKGKVVKNLHYYKDKIYLGKI